MLRRLILTPFVLILFIVFVLYNGWNLFKINDGLKDLILSRLRTVVGDDCSVDRLRLGFGSVNLEGVTLTFRDSPYQVTVDELRLGYSFESLLRGTADPEKIADEIEISRPRLSILFNPRESLDADVDLSLQLSTDFEERYRSLIKEYDFIKRITIDDGEIQLRDIGDSSVTRLAKSINGWAYTDDKGKAWIRLAGHLFESSDYNMVMYGQLDLKRGGIDRVNVDITSYQLSNELPFLLPDYLQVLAGEVDAHLTLTERYRPTRGFNIEGSVGFKDGDLRLSNENLFFQNVQLQAKIKGRDIEITSAEQDINGSPTQLNGTIHNFLNPEFDLHLTSDAIHLQTFLTQLLPNQKLNLSGEAAVDLAIQNEAARPRVSGVFSCDTLRVYDQTITGLTVALTLEDLILRLHEIRSTVGEAALTGGGTVDFLSPEKMLSFDLSLAGSFKKHLHRLGLYGARKSSGSATIKVFGPVRKPVSTGELSLVIKDAKLDSFALEGSFRFSQDRLVWGLSSSERAMKVNGAVDSVSFRPYYNLEATNTEVLLGLSGNPVFDFLAHRFSLNLSGEGSRAGVELRVDGYDEQSYEKVFTIGLQSTRGSDLAEGVGEIILFPNENRKHKGSFDTKREASGAIVARVEIEDWLQGDLTLNSSGEPEGKFSISGLDASLLSRLAGVSEADYRGTFYGQLLLGAAESGDDLYSGSFWLMDGFWGDVGPLAGRLEFRGDASLLHLKKFSLQDAESDALNLVGDGTFHFRTRQIDAALAGSNVRVDKLLSLFTDSHDLVAGNAMIQVALRGRWPAVSLSGNVLVHNAKILMLEFDEVRLNFDEAGANGTSYLTEDVLHIGRAEVIKADDFVLAGVAELPLRGSGDLRVNLSGDGNFLSMLPDLAAIFGESQSSGHLDLKLAGKYTRPDFSGSHLWIRDGEVSLSDVVKRVSNIQADVEVLPDEYFMKIHQLSGTIKGRTFAIKNTNDLASLVEGKSLEPLRIAGDDLNLGALILTTSSDGVPLHIPGLMESGEVGYYALGGYSANESLFVSGPWRRPAVRGKARVRSANLMFPFDEGVGDGNPIVRNVIENIDWNFYAIAGKDTRYVRQFPAGIYVNMELDKENSRLEFRGVRKDSTFTIGGKVESARGEIEYFDLNFRVEKVGAEFNQSSFYPNVYGRAWTVVRDSTNAPSDVYLTLFTVDDTGQELNTGRWDRINVKLSSQYPTFDETQGDIMATLGYSSENIEAQARKAIGSSTDNFLFRPLLRPLERELERKLQLDVVRFSYAIAQNFLNSNFNDQLGSSLSLLRSSRLVLGKYLTEDLYLIYSGELKAGIDYQFQDKGVGLQHIVGLEYRLNNKWLLQMEYDYNTLLELHRDDKKVRLRHTFPF